MLNGTLSKPSNKSINGSRANVKGGKNGGSFITPKIKYHGAH